MSPTSANPSLSTLTVHGDDDVNKIPAALQQEVSDVAPALHVSTTFRYSRNPDELVEAKDCDVSACVCGVGAVAEGVVAREPGNPRLRKGDSAQLY